ncbi:MAG: GGDEF domain-containing protein [Candidatus Hydrogenedentota bacterium]|nr:MAG: GGDEF domain-containing protein [Candidatus Hydrogenedentota bacterium]
MDENDTLRIDPESSEFPTTERAGLLQIIRGEDIGREYEVKPGNNIVGRQKNCHIQITNKSISRRHAQIVYGPDEPPDSRYVIYDLQSTNGTKVNNEVTIERALRDGDRVQFGSVVCKFMEVDSIEKSYLKELKRLIEYDKQTDLLQIKPFYQKLEKALSDAESSNESLSVLMMDLDGLKQINDTHGHPVGTHVIIKISRLINEEFSPSGVAAIYGGDEFAVYLPDTTRNEALEKAERLRKLVADLRFAEKRIQERVTISIGVAEYPTDASEMPTLVANADRALYAAKSAGKNLVIAYDPSMTETTRK